VFGEIQLFEAEKDLASEAGVKNKYKVVCSAGDKLFAWTRRTKGKGQSLRLALPLLSETVFHPSVPTTIVASVIIVISVT